RGRRSVRQSRRRGAAATSSAAPGGAPGRRQDPPGAVRGAGSSGSRPARQAPPYSAGDDIKGCYGDDDQQQNGADIGVVEFADGNKQVLADAAGANKADDRAGSYIDLEAQQRIAGEVRQRLRQRTKPHRVDKTSARGADPLDRIHVDVFEDFGEQLTERTEAVQADRQNPCKRSEPESADEDQGKDQVRHRAAELEQPLDAPA